MKKKILISFSTLFAVLFFSFYANSQNVANFENLSLAPNSFWNGSDNSGGFYSGGFYFPNSFTDYGGGMYAWYGFAYSNKSDTLTIGYTNQFSAITGKGASNTANYAVSYVNYDWMNNYNMIPNTVRFPNSLALSGFYVTNSTYAYYSMLYGDGSLAKKFGGPSENDPDWFKLQIKGYYNGLLKDTIDFYLADFRFSNNSQDYILKEWKWVDLSSMGLVDSISFGLTSSDMGAYGMNTPSYFCFDELNASSPNTFIDNFEISNNIVLYPLPANDKLYFKILDNNEINNIKLFSLSGLQIKSLNIEDGTNFVDLSGLPSGIYFLELSTGKNKHYKKIVKN